MSSSGDFFEKATYARSHAGHTKLVSDFTDSLNKLTKTLNGDKYGNFKATINANWYGPDSIDFLNDIEKTRKQLEAKINDLKVKFSEAMSNDSRQFDAFQAKNIQ